MKALVAYESMWGNTEAVARAVGEGLRGAAGTGDVQVVNVRNDGAIANLASDDVVEIAARVDAGGAHPIDVAPLAPEQLGLVQAVKAYERLAIAAATSGDRTIALKALMANPLSSDYRVAAPLLDALLEANRDHLPAFFDGR